MWLIHQLDTQRSALLIFSGESSVILVQFDLIAGYFRLRSLLA